MTQLVNRLKEEGFLIPVKGGRTKLSKPVKTIEQITKKQTCYSNPMTSISHHVSSAFLDSRNDQS